MSTTVAERRIQPADRLVCRLAETDAEIDQALRLRYKVFAEELGARLPSAKRRRDVDHFDAHCRHLIVINETNRRVLGCTRLLDDAGAAAAGGFYSEQEFELDAIRALPGRRLEVGRSCIHPQFRNGAGIGLLWQGLAAMVAQNGYDWLFGCASISWGEDGAAVQATLERLRRRHLVEPARRARPLHPLPAQRSNQALTALRMPPLLKAYLGLGARACGEPCWDADFGVADVLMLLDLEQLSARHARHFFRRRSA